MLSWLQVEDPKAIDFLTNPERYIIIAPFFEAPKSVSEASQEAQKTFEQMFYLTNKAVQLGLLEVVDTQKRKGRAIKRYRCVAKAFFVPYHLMKESLRATLLESELNFLPSQLDAALHSHPFGSSILSSDEWGKVYTMDGPQHFSVFVSSNKQRFARAADYYDYLAWEHPKPYFDITHKGIKLSPEDAKAWHRELLALDQKYALKRVDEGPEHYVRLFIAQMPEDTQE